MIFLRLCCVRMYAAFCHERRYMGRMLTGRAYIWGRESRQVKSAKNLTVDRNGFTKPRCSEQQHGCAETREIIRFRAKSHGTEKSIGVTCGQDIITAILSGFESKAFFTMQRSGCAEWRTGFAFSLSEFWRGFEYECTQ